MRGDVETETHNSSDDLRVEDLCVDTNVDPAMDGTPMNGFGVAQGGFVSSFTLGPREVSQAVDSATTQLQQLMAECDPSDTDSWRRIRGKKGSRVRLWEKGCPSPLTHTGLERAAKPITQTRRKSLPGPQDQRHRATISETVFSTVNPDNEQDTYAVRSSITVRASLPSVMKALDCSTSTSYRSFTKIIYENLVTDTSVLSHKQLTAEPPIHAHLADSVAVRWIVCKCSPPLVSDCDLCLLEYTKVHTIDELIAANAAPNNNRSDSEANDAMAYAGNGLRSSSTMPKAFKTLRSMESKHCPVLGDSPHHLVRVQIPLGGFLLYTTDNDNVTDVVFFMSVKYDRTRSVTSSLGNAKPSFLSSDDRQFRAIQMVLHQMALAIDRLTNAVDAYTMSMQLESLRATRWIEDSDRSECIVCYRRFHPITRRRHHCRMCGDVICRDCSIHKDADLPTVGPTTLRICKLCNVEHFSRSSMLASIANDLKAQTTRVQRRATTHTDQVSRQRNQATGAPRRQTTLSIETCHEKLIVEPANPLLSRTRRHSVEAPLSCPKPTAKVPSRSQTSMASPTLASPGKWSKAFHANRALISPTTRQPHPLDSPQSKFARTMPLPRSVSKDMHQTQSPIKRFNFGLMKSGMMSPLSRPRQHSMADSLDSHPGATKTAPMGFAATMPVKGTPASSLLKRPVVSASNQSQELLNTDNQDNDAGRISLSHRALLTGVSDYEDLLREMCERASDATTAKYASLSIFTAQDPGATVTTTHYLKTTGSQKLMRIAANMLCCEPVLRMLRPVATGNALTFRLDGYDFATLPFVKGPQRVRFYVGIPLVDSKNRVLGALAVFDPKVEDDEEELTDCVGFLNSIARATISRIEARKADTTLKSFMKTPLLRHTEPQVLRRENDITGTDDEGESDDEHTRTVSQYEPHHPPASSSSSKRESIEYYKRQMHRLVQQAQQTQGQVLQNALNMQGVSY